MWHNEGLGLCGTMRAAGRWFSDRLLKETMILVKVDWACGSRE